MGVAPLVPKSLPFPPAPGFISVPATGHEVLGFQGMRSEKLPFGTPALSGHHLSGLQEL